MQRSSAGSPRILFLIAARGGSKRLPGKNVRLFGGIPLVGTAVRRAQAAGRMQGNPFVVACSTDDPAIAEAAARWGAAVPFIRPAGLSSDTASSADVAIHALEWYENHGTSFDLLVLVQPTSPLAPPSDLVSAAAAALNADSAVSVSATHGTGSSYMLRDDLLAEPPAQDVDGQPCRVNGSAYAISPKRLRAARSFVVPGSTVGVITEPTVDIGTAEDFEQAQAILARRRSPAVRVGECLIGGGNPTFVIAEAGVNHNGDVNLAHRLIDAAASARVDAVKFQTFDPSSLAAPEAPTAEYQRRATGALTSQREMLQSVALGRESFAALKAHAEDVGITFLSSPFDYGSADLLDEIGVAAFKIPSGEVTNTPFLEHVARKGKPMLVSTGMCDMLETAAAVDAIRASGLDEIALFHCVSVYPASPAACNLRSMATLRAAFGLPVGWSDHTPGSDVSVAAVAMGAELIEKHITLDRTLPGPDHEASLEPEEFRRLVASIRTTEACLGDGTKRPTPEEAETAMVARKSLHWLVDREPGQIVAAGDLAALRPGGGLAPSLQASLSGKVVRRSVRTGNQVSSEDFGSES